MLGLDMLGKAVLLAGLTAAIVVLVGCHHDKYGVKYTPKEEYVLPPDDIRYNQPPTAEYRKPPAKKDDAKTLLNANNKMGPNPQSPGGF